VRRTVGRRRERGTMEPRRITLLRWAARSRSERQAGTAQTMLFVHGLLSPWRAGNALTGTRFRKKPDSGLCYGTIGPKSLGFRDRRSASPSWKVRAWNSACEEAFS